MPRVSNYLDSNGMARIGPWYLCNDVVALVKAMGKDEHPPPTRLLLLEGDTWNPLMGGNQDLRLQRMGPDLPAGRLRAYFQAVPQENQYWNDEQESRLHAADESLFDRRAKLRVQYEWFCERNQPEHRSFTLYLERLHRVVDYYSSHPNHGPAMGGNTGVQFAPLEPTFWLDEETFLGSEHPQQLDRFEILFEE